MEKKLINVVWCDDNIDRLDTEDNKYLFSYHNCVLFKKAKTSDALKDILTDYRNQIDAVIVDFNMGDKDLIPGRESASGFRWVHEHVEDYAPIPFYLYSGREEEFIRNKYRDFEFPIDNDYFLCNNQNIDYERNRHFQSNELDDLLSMIEEEVANISTPEYRIRQEYSKAFAAINKFGLDGNLFTKILLLEESTVANELTDKINPLRQQIEALISRLVIAEVLPEYISKPLNKVPSRLRDGLENCSPEDRMHPSLFKVFRTYIDLVQEGSHDGQTAIFTDYLKSTRDVYIIKALAIICLDIIRWASAFYDKNESLHLFPKFEPFTAVVKKLKTVNGQEGAIVYDSLGKKYFVYQHPAEKYKYEVGTNVRIEKREFDDEKKYGDYICYRGKNLDVYEE